MVRYENRMAKTAAAKRLAKERNISVREAEWSVGDANAYLEEQWQWAPQWAPPCEYLCQHMFLHAAATGQSKNMTMLYCQGQREPLPKWDLGAEPTAMELIHPDSTWEDIEDLYQGVYQLWRLPGRDQCEEATKECLHRKILDSLKECLQLKWPSTQLDGAEAVASWHPLAWPSYGVCHC